MFEREILMIPGPTNVDRKVLRALSKPTISHTSQEFANIFKEALNNLKKVFMTNSEVFVIAGSGTLALEMAIANIVEPGDKVLNSISGFSATTLLKYRRFMALCPAFLKCLGVNL